MKSVPWCRHGEKMRRHFYQLDVFTDKPLAGNPLAVITDGDGLSPRQMQAIAREMNLSETVFVQKPPAIAHWRACAFSPQNANYHWLAIRSSGRGFFWPSSAWYRPRRAAFTSCSRQALASCPSRSPSVKVGLSAWP